MIKKIKTALASQTIASKGTNVLSKEDLMNVSFLKYFVVDSYK
jgi:hypothetical protein